MKTVLMVTAAAQYSSGETRGVLGGGGYGRLTHNE